MSNQQPLSERVSAPKKRVSAKAKKRITELTKNFEADSQRIGLNGYVGYTPIGKAYCAAYIALHSGDKTVGEVLSFMQIQYDRKEFGDAEVEKVTKFLQDF